MECGRFRNVVAREVQGGVGAEMADCFGGGIMTGTEMSEWVPIRWSSWLGFQADERGC